LDVLFVKKEPIPFKYKLKPAEFYQFWALTFFKGPEGGLGIDSNYHSHSIYSNIEENEIYFSTMKSKFNSISNEEFYFYYFLFYNQTSLLNVI
jgi:hypothetical protein